jgi:formate-dependent nitrite reductase membrane component NrfD
MSAATSSSTRFSRPRFAMLVLIGAYPLITSLLYLVFPLTEGWSIWQRTLVIVPLMVSAMVWGSRGIGGDWRPWRKIS